MISLKFAPILILAVVALQGQELVEVKELPPDIIRDLKAVDAELESAAKSLASAQAKAIEVKQRKAEIEQRAKVGLNSTEGECSTRYPESTGNTTYAVAYVPSRSFRRVTISGKFLLVHAGTESCPTSYWTTNNAVTLEGRQ